MGSPRLNLSKQYAFITLKACLFLSTVMKRGLGRAWGRSWRFLRTRATCFRPNAAIARSLLSPATVPSMVTESASAGVTKRRRARVDTEKAQTANLGLLNVVRCYGEWTASLTIASHALTRNIQSRCFYA